MYYFLYKVTPDKGILCSCTQSRVKLINDCLKHTPVFRPRARVTFKQFCHNHFLLATKIMYLLYKGAPEKSYFTFL